MLNYFTVFYIVLLLSCGYTQKQESAISANESNVYTIEKDTLISYNLEGVSAGGAEAKVSYRKGKITQSLIKIYGETG